jgi:hypothetical protein
MDCPCIFEVAWIGHARQQTPAGHPRVAATIDCSKGNVTNKYYFQKDIGTSHFVDFVKTVASFPHTAVVTSPAAPVSTAAPHYRSARGRTLRQVDAKGMALSTLSSERIYIVEVQLVCSMTEDYCGSPRV